MSRGKLTGRLIFPFWWGFRLTTYWQVSLWKSNFILQIFFDRLGWPPFSVVGWPVWSWNIGAQQAQKRLDGTKVQDWNWEIIQRSAGKSLVAEEWVWSWGWLRGWVTGVLIGWARAGVAERSWRRQDWQSFFLFAVVDCTTVKDTLLWTIRIMWHVMQSAGYVTETSVAIRSLWQVVFNSYSVLLTSFAPFKRLVHTLIHTPMFLLLCCFCY